LNEFWYLVAASVVSALTTRWYVLKTTTMDAEEYIDYVVKDLPVGGSRRPNAPLAAIRWAMAHNSGERLTAGEFLDLMAEVEGDRMSLTQSKDGSVQLWVNDPVKPRLFISCQPSSMDEADWASFLDSVVWMQAKATEKSP